jgi:hypothetical protein
LSQPTETGEDSLKFRVATSNSTSTPSWNYLGPDGTVNTYYTSATTTMSSIHNGDRYVRYRAYFNTASTSFTPTFSDISLTYTNSCTPPGQVYFGGVTDQEYTVEVVRSGFQISSESVTVSGDIIYTADLVSS